jgi:hypothetical protein
VLLLLRGGKGSPGRDEEGGKLRKEENPNPNPNPKICAWSDQSPRISSVRAWELAAIGKGWRKLWGDYGTKQGAKHVVMREQQQHNQLQHRWRRARRG